MTWILFLIILLHLFQTEGSILFGSFAPWISREKTSQHQEEDLVLFQNSLGFNKGIKPIQKSSGEETYYVKLLNSANLYGKWSNEGEVPSQGGFFDEAGGLVETSKIENTDQEHQIWNVYVSILDGGYLSSKAISLSLEQFVSLFDFNLKNATFIGRNLIIRTFFYGNTTDEGYSKNCFVNSKIYFIDILTKTPFGLDGDKRHLGVQFEIQSDDCDISFVTSVMTTTKIPNDELIFYISIMCLSAFAGILSTEKLVAGFPNNMNQLEKLSVWSLCLTNAWDFFLFVFHAAFFIAFSGWLVVITIFFFVLSALYQTKLTYAVFFSCNQGAALSLSSQRRFLASYYIGLMIFNMSYIYWSYNSKIVWTLLTSSLFLFPQIIHIYKRGRNYKFNHQQVGGFSLSRIVFIAYVTLYPKNIYGYSAKPLFAAIYFGLILLQVFILTIQKRWPKFCMTPPRYNYYVKLTTEKEKEEECPICMEKLGTATTTTDITKPLIYEKEVILMKTPCNHVFHEECLKAWMRSKLECPFDRSPLPPLNNEDFD